MDPMAPFEPWRQQHRRTAYLPVTGTEPSPSQFGGAPWLPAGEAWPACPRCGNPRHLIVQLDLAALPPELAAAHGPGLLQVFYCARPDCEVDAEGWSAFSDIHLLRIVDARAPGGDAAPMPDALPAHPIAGWTPMPDLPDPEEQRDLGIERTYDFRAKTVRVSWASGSVEVSGPSGVTTCLCSQYANGPFTIVSLKERPGS